MIVDKSFFEDNPIIVLENESTNQWIYKTVLIGNKTMVWNPITDKYMNYFYEDCPKGFKLNLSILNQEWDNYLIDDDLNIYGPKKKLTVRKDIWGYPEVKIKGRYHKIHSIVSKLFIPNSDPTIKTVVDHINRDKDNYRLNNLRWVTTTENMNNITRHNWIGSNIYKAFLDKKKTNLVFTLNGKEFYEKYPGYKEKSKVLNSVKKNTKFKGYYWEIIDLDLVEYLKKINIDSIDDSQWVLHYSGNLFVHPIGIIKHKRRLRPSVGALIGDKNVRLERSVNTGKGKIRVHRLVAEVFLNNNQPLKDGVVIDHINTDSLDNRVSNLRICSQAENMNNPLTRRKLSKIILDSNGNEFNSITECAKFYGVTVANIWARLNGKRPSRGFKYKYKTSLSNYNDYPSGGE